jgi:hypothetical protein
MISSLARAVSGVLISASPETVDSLHVSYNVVNISRVRPPLSIGANVQRVLKC